MTYISLRRTLLALLTLLMGYALAGAQTTAPAFTHAGVARDAERYETNLRTQLGAVATKVKARDTRLAGERILASGTDARIAMRQLATATVADPKDADGWLSLARSLLAITPDPKLPSERYDLPVNASAAAYIAYDRAPTRELKARALATLGEALKRRSYWRPAIDALRTSVTLVESADVRKAYELLRSEHGFRVLDYTVENEASEPRVCIQLSERLQRGIADLSKFVTVDGRDPAAVTGEGNQLCVDGLTHGRRHELLIRAGLPSDIGETLLGDRPIAVYVKDRTPSVRVTGKSYVLPTRGQQGIPVVTINTTRVAVEIYRVGDRNLNAVIGGDFQKQLSSGDVANLAGSSGAKVYQGELEVVSKLNEEVTTAVPVNEAIPEIRPGVYAMIAKPAEGKTRDDGDQLATQWFIVSDLGLTALTGENGVHVFVRSLSTTEPILNASVRLVARNNEVLALGQTNGAGYVRFEPGLARGEGGAQAQVLVAETSNGQYAFLDIASAAFDLSDRGVKGRTRSGPIDAFIYPERGVYRPGETVHLTTLVRDRTGNAVPVPVTLIVSRPDGVEHRRIALTDQSLGGRSHALALSSSAMTGTWRIKLHTDPKADPIATVAFLVEDFVPDRLDATLTSAARTIGPEETQTITLSGKYLYGPPAANLATEAEIVVRASTREPEGLAGYRFGLADEKLPPVRKSIDDVPATDGKGAAAINVTLPPIPRTARQLEADLIVRLREPGGRAIERNIVIPVDPRMPRIGIRPLFRDDSLADGELGQFDVIHLDAQGRRATASGTTWTLYRLDTNWQWYRRDGSWTFDQVTLTRKVGGGTIDIAAAGDPARITSKLEPGRYRLEVTSTQPGGPSSSYVFRAGWYGGEAADSPEMLDVALDKASYKPGETAKLRISSRQGGKALVMALDNGLLWQRAVDLPNGGGEVPVEVSAAWGSGAYVTAFLYRSIDEKTRRMPSRAVGLKWLALDQGDRTLKVSLGAADKIGSGAKMTVPVKIENLARGEEARLTLAAVDVGILNLTRFETPAPERWFFAQTQLGTEIRDLYGRLIDGMRAERGKLRSGGDEGGGMSSKGSPPTEAIVALYSGIVRVGADGTANVEFQLPDFNGTVRLSAVAWSANKLGSTSKDVIVRDPVALTLSSPRFLTLGDEARLDVAMHNVEGAAGRYRLDIARLADGATVGQSVTGRDVALNAGERKSERLSLKPTEPGLAHYDVRVTGPGGIDVKRRLTLDTKLPAGDVKRVTVSRLDARTGRITLSEDLLTDLLPARTSVNVSVGPLAAMDVPGLLTMLDRYPYGCAEQTVSRALPLLYANALAVDAGMRSDAALKGKIQGAIERVLEMQDSSGAFGIWGPRNADMWLTAFVTDFLSRAKETGHEVKAQALTQALDRLQNFVAYGQDFEKGGEDRAYALYVLARNGRAPIGELRYWVDTRLERFDSPLARAQLGAALAMLGDKDRAEKAFRAALTMKEPTGLRFDYGSSLRDNAALVTLASETRTLRNEAVNLAGVLGRTFQSRAYTSTQEQAWMLLAARALADEQKNARVSVGGVSQQGALSRRLSAAELKSGALTIVNESDTAVDAVVSVIGAALTPEPATSKGFTIERSYYTMDGKKVDLRSASGGTGELSQTDRLVVVVKVEATEKGGRVMLVDRLPAGLEIENPRLVDSADLKSLDWLKTTVKPEHTEFRDDRFVAAFNFSGRRNRSGDDDDDSPSGPASSATVAYMVRAVTPGNFVHPAATVEDMYRPERFARTATGRLTVKAKE